MTLDIDSIDKLLHNGVRDNVYPGAVGAIGDATGTKANGAVGLLDPSRPDQPMRLDTIFDIASLTKILAVWASIGTLIEDGKLQLNEPLGTFWPEITGHPLGSGHRPPSPDPHRRPPPPGQPQEPLRNRLPGHP